jgi:spore coat-associated protein N
LCPQKEQIKEHDSMSTKPARNVFSSGRLIQANASDGVAASTGYDMQPGEVRIGIVRIANLGTLPRRLRLFELDASSDFRVGELRLEIADAESKPPVLLFSGEVGAVPHEGIDLGGFEAGEERTYLLTFTCADDATGSGLERVAGAAYVWSAPPEGEGARKSAGVTGSGNLVRASSGEGAVLVAGPDLKPGQRQSGEVRIVNLGTLPVRFRLCERSAGTAFAPGRLGLAIHELTEDARRRLYLGEIGSVPDLDLGCFEAGESRIYRFTVLLAKSTPKGELGRAAGAAYDWLAAPLGGR